METDFLKEIINEKNYENENKQIHDYTKIPRFKMNNWNSKIEKTVKLIEKQCKIYKKIHDEISIENNSKYSCFMIIAIIITPMSGIITAIGTILSKDFEQLCVYSITSTILSFLSSIFISIIKFNKYDEISYSHKTSYSRYVSLEENIKRQLLLYREDRINAHEYLNWLTKSFDELFDSSPNFDNKIYKKYLQQLEEIEKEYDNIEINFNRQDSYNKKKFLQKQDLNLFNDDKMKLEIRRTE